MDVKLMLVLTFTTIVVVAGSPLQADIAAFPPQAKAQLISLGDCNYVTLQDGRRFCVKLAVTSKKPSSLADHRLCPLQYVVTSGYISNKYDTRTSNKKR